MAILGDKIRDFKIILGSSSPRRRDLLKAICIDFELDGTSHVNEDYPEDLPHHLIPETLAYRKSIGFHRELTDNEILITADTLVFCPSKENIGEEIVLGKPQDREDAFKMLSLLSDNTHTVLTSVCIRDHKRHTIFTESSDVTFRKLEQEEIDYYLDTFNPYDKAGSYAVQEWIGHVGIANINGSQENVMGLPTQKLYLELKRFIELS